MAERKCVCVKTNVSHSSRRDLDVGMITIEICAVRNRADIRSV